MPTHYKQPPSRVSSMDRVDRGSSEIDEPFIDTRPDERNEKPTDDGEDGMRRKFRNYIKRKWNSTKHLLDDKPYKVKDSWGNFFWHLSKRLLTTYILLSAIVFGAAGTSFNITKFTLWKKVQIDQDIQLAAFGIINTILAHMVRDSLAHIADTLVTRRMVSEKGRGATVLDFEMKEELTKPWIAVSTFYSRRKQTGWTARNILRLALSFTIGACLLLQGAGINTVGMPKTRWWPDTRYVNPKPGDNRFFFSNKTMRVANVSRMAVWDRSWNMIREGGDMSWELAHTFGAISILESLEQLYETSTYNAGWYPIGNSGGPVQAVLNVTDTPTRSIQAASINGKATAEMWDEQRASGPPWARRALGWYATLKLTSLLLDTACIEAPGHPVGSWEASSTHNGTIILTIGPMTEEDDDFPGATCTTSIEQVLITIQQWIIDDDIDRSRPAWSIDNWGAWAYPAISPLPSAPPTSSIAAELASWFNAISPTLQRLTTTNTTTTTTTTTPAPFTALALHLATALTPPTPLNTSTTTTTTTHGLSTLTAVLLSHTLTTLTWTFDDLRPPNTTTNPPLPPTLQGPIRWKIYGSGPRLQWQWAISAVIGVTALVQLFDIWLLLRHRQAKGLWLGLGGMLVAANAAARMGGGAVAPRGQGAGFVGERGRGVRYFVRERRGRGGEGKGEGDGDEDGDGGGVATLVSGCELMVGAHGDGAGAAGYKTLDAGVEYGG
ncbi:uncharacterized protein BKCO1_5900070 [Diplodia corticola]|uniref:Uncharacterized protein n=1 Tax=Diplodia corticola TaxID=236234 RepID=A0A1J9RD89_9PEZI|nr:uncharacterized protein BKCO1_5900070 [Diplodia corticola]OJD30499.1 hypothetical protein BKCO1_5900070 [Diplodia corticola]